MQHTYAPNCDLDRPVTVEEARAAMAKIHARMDAWGDQRKDAEISQASPYRGARVRALGGFRQRRWGQDRILWYVSAWTDPFLHSLLFVERADGVLLSEGDVFFDFDDLVPAQQQEGGAK